MPIDGRDFNAWVEFIPGATLVSSREVPDPRVDAAGLVIVYEITVRQAQPGMQAAIYPPVVRFGDGSAHQLPSSASVVIVSIPDRDGSGLASPSNLRIAGRETRVTGSARAEPTDLRRTAITYGTKSLTTAVCGTT